MTLDELKKRLDEIEKAMQQCMANFNVLEGGKQECLYWINKIKETEKIKALDENELKKMLGAESIELMERKI